MGELFPSHSKRARGEAEGRRTTLYRLLDKGTWEYKRNRVTSFLSTINTPIAGDIVLQNGKMLFGSVYELKDYKDFNKSLDAINKYLFQNSAMVGMLEKVFKDTMKVKKAAITILYDSEAVFSINGVET